MIRLNSAEDFEHCGYSHLVLENEILAKHVSSYVFKFGGTVAPSPGHAR